MPLGNTPGLRRTWGLRYGVVADPDEGTADDVIRFQGYTLNLKRRAVYDARGREVEITSLEFEALVVLASRPGEIVTRDDLMFDTKGHSREPLDRSIDNLISRLRRKLSPDGNREAFIKTVRGRGYVLVA